MASDKKTQITQERLKELLQYNQETGVFTWIVSRSGTNGVGSICGCKQSQGYISIELDGISYYAHRLVFLYVEVFSMMSSKWMAFLKALSCS